MEKRNLEQRLAIKFCVKLNENATETYEKLRRTYGEHALARTQVFRWHEAFLDGRESVEDEPRCARPCTSKTDESVTKVRDLVSSDRRLTVRMISSVLNLNRQTIHEILTFELGMQKICAKLVPKFLTNEQKENRRNVCLDLLERIENDKNVFKHVITGDETWIFEYDPDNKRQSSEWHTSNSPRPNKARMSKSKIKTTLICFFDTQGVVHKEFVPPGQTVNKQYYREFFERLRKGFIVSCQRLRHLDAASRQCSLSHCHLRERIFGQKSSVVPQPPYSPDLSPCDFFLFPKLKFDLKGRHFGTVDNTQTVVTDKLRALLHEDFHHCYREWEQRLRRCVASQGNYFEGDNVDL